MRTGKLSFDKTKSEIFYFVKSYGIIKILSRSSRPYKRPPTLLPSLRAATPQTHRHPPFHHCEPPRHKPPPPTVPSLRAATPQATATHRSVLASGLYPRSNLFFNFPTPQNAVLQFTRDLPAQKKDAAASFSFYSSSNAPV